MSRQVIVNRLKLNGRYSEMQGSGSECAYRISPKGLLSTRKTFLVECPAILGDEPWERKPVVELVFLEIGKSNEEETRKVWIFCIK